MAINETVTAGLLVAYNSLVNSLPEKIRVLPPLILVAAIITLYSVFIYVFYRFLAKRDIIKLNLSKYNTSRYPGLIKFFAFIFYVIKYIIIAPIAVFLWFSLFTIIFIFLARELDLYSIILISAALISAIRITAYISEDLSKDLAKMFPFTLLGIVILTPGFFNISTMIERIAQIPLFFNNLIYYFLFMVVLEAALRLIYLPFAVKDSDEESKSKRGAKDF